jgi:hypothetical protein
MITPNKEALRQMVRDGLIDDGYLLVAVCLHQLVDGGAVFFLSETQIEFIAPGVCDWCRVVLPLNDVIANYYIDIITPNL